MSKSDRQARIELGQNWGHQYNAQTDIIMQNDIIPQFKQGNFSKGIVDGVKSLSALANDVYIAKSLTPMQKLIGIISIILLISLIISLFRSGRSGWSWALIAFLGFMIWWLLHNIRASGSGGMFGGGSSGGGSSSGSW